MTIHGVLVIDKSIPTFSDTTATITLEDVGRIDAGADVIHREILHNISHTDGEKTEVEFKFDCKASDDSHPKYNLRAHVDVTGSGDVEVGDLVTQQSYPVHPEASRKHELRVKNVS
ncbi:hypothetical protein [Rhodohalobacter sp. 8-1]|uniref:hypothetical protein n=1 Tax=Rhodohalobacter sp. 8-1 TaxID=3131972 RepID=UPI0030EBCED9